MRVRTILLIPVVLCTTVHAAKLVTVEQVRQILLTSPSDSDAKVAQKIAALEMGERIDTATLSRWQADAPGNHTLDALLQLADASAFLDLPPSEIVDQPPPDTTNIHQIIGRTIDYPGKVLPNLPNLTAMRNTSYFEDSPWQQEVDNAQSSDAHQNAHSMASSTFIVGMPYYMPLSESGKLSTQVTYRDGHEVQVDSAKSDRPNAPETRLTSRGEFGPVLAVVIGDAFRNKLFWDHWEQSSGSPVATFRYVVPPGASRYMVAYPSEEGVKRLFPPYHGKITVDPATGAVLRLTLIAEMPQPYQRAQAALAVEYGPVLLGDGPYICPLRSVNLSREPLAGETQSIAPTLRTYLNDVLFTNYHLFHADARIVSTTPLRGGDSPTQPH
jgi:hypothetical protein